MLSGIEISDADLRCTDRVPQLLQGRCANITCLPVFRTVNPAPNMVLIGTALHQTYVRQLAAAVDAIREAR